MHTNIYGTGKTEFPEGKNRVEGKTTHNSISCHLAKEYKKWFHTTHPAEQLPLKHHLQKQPSINPQI